MNEIGRARARRYATSLSDANWSVDPSASGGQDSVGFWLHSCSMVSGPRLVGQLTLEGYREMQAGFPAYKLGALQAFDVLGASLSEFDSIESDARNAHDSAMLTAALAIYARATKTWERLPQLSTTSAIHFLVFDWHTNKTNRIMKPAAIVSHEMLSPDALIQLGAQVLAAHLTKYPNEVPIY